MKSLIRGCHLNGLLSIVSLSVKGHPFWVLFFSLVFDVTKCEQKHAENVNINIPGRMWRGKNVLIGNKIRSDGTDGMNQSAVYDRMCNMLQ